MVARRDAMRAEQDAAKREIQEREARKLEEEAGFERLRQTHGAALSAWSEEYGKKKDVRALLAGLERVLWEGSGWKPIGLGDLLEPKKVKLAYRKACLKVRGQLWADRARLAARGPLDASTP